MPSDGFLRKGEETRTGQDADKILEKRGNYDNHKLVDVFEKYKFRMNGEFSRKEALKFSNKLDRQRGTAVAHLTRSNQDTPSLSGQQVYELKTFVDVLVFKHANVKLYGQPMALEHPIHLPFSIQTK